MSIGGNHTRHLFFINIIQKKYPLAAAIIEKRENISPQIPDYINEIDRKNFVRHFENRKMAEKKYFGNQSIPNCKTIEVEKNNLNSNITVDFVNSIKPDLVLIFGTNLIKDPLYSVLPKHSINLHLGISPRYRGSATLFWPFYFMEPNYAGSTFHYIISEPDAGNIIHQTTPKLELKDGIHDVACKTVVSSAMDVLELLRIFEEKREWKKYEQKGSGKNFLQSDFKPEHLRVIYNIFNDDMVRHYLEGKLKSKSPNLIRQF